MHDYFPFSITTLDTLNLPVTLFENSKYKFELIPIQQNFIDKVFPNQNITKLDSPTMPYRSKGFNSRILAEVYKNLLEGNIFLRTLRKDHPNQDKNIGIKNAQKYNKGINAMLDVFQLFTGISLNNFLCTNDAGNLSGKGRIGNYRQPSSISSSTPLSVGQIENIIKYTKLYISANSKKLDVVFELLRNSDINSHNTYPLKCSLLVIVIESFFLEHKRSDKDNFDFCLKEYFSDDKESNYKSYYANRSLYFHSGINKFKGKDWRTLHNLSKILICNYLDDKTTLENKVAKIKESI